MRLQIFVHKNNSALKFYFGHYYYVILILVQPLRLQPILKGLPGDADHVADADRLERTGVGELIGRRTADTENGCDVIHGVCSALGRSFFVGCVGAHKIILHLC